MSDDRFIPYEQALAAQGESLERVQDRLDEQLAELTEIGSAERPVFVGIGASYAASALPVFLLRRRGIPALRVCAGDLPLGTPALGDVVIGVSQSGRSSETIDYLMGADAAKAAVVNVPGSPLAQLSPVAIDLGGQRDSKASTIGFTGTLLALGRLADRWGPSQEADQRTVAVAGAIQCLVKELESRSRAALVTVAEAIASATSVDVVGHEASVAAAEEGALLLREVCRVPAAGFDLRNYLHGAEESATPGRTAHLIFGMERGLELAGSMAERGLTVALVTDLPEESTAALRQAGAPVVTLPDVDHTTRVILETIVMQHVALMVAGKRHVPADEFLATALDTKVDDLAQLGTAPS